jgi:rhodanese-related sulfurtransferase
LSPFQQGMREAAWILLAATVLGFSYTASFKKGFFRAAADEQVTLHNRPSPNLPIIDLAFARGLFESGAALFVDGRHEFDYQLGHIKGAINIPLKEFERRKSLLASLPKDRTIVTYCDGAECNSSIELAARLYAEGFTDVRIFFGGWNEWNAQRLPTERSEP